MSKENASEEFVQSILSATTNNDLSTLRTLIPTMQSFNPRSLPSADLLLETAAQNGHVEAITYFFTTLPECQGKYPWYPSFPPGFTTMDDLPKYWTCIEYGVVHACIEGKDPYGTIRVLVEAGMSPNQELQTAGTVLSRSIGTSSKLTAFLLERGGDPNSMHQNMYLLEMAAAHTTGEAMELLLAWGARVEGSHALRGAAKYWRIGNAERLMELGADVNEVYKLESWDSTTIIGSPLTYAVTETLRIRPITDSLEAMVRWLLQKGANVKAVDRYERTALQIAKEQGMTDIVKMLEEASQAT